MSDPAFVALRTDLRDGTITDFQSGWSISGSQVKPFPTDPAQAATVRTRLDFNILVEATEDEYEAQNPVIVPPPAVVSLTEPVRVSELTTPAGDGFMHVVPLQPATTAVFVVDPIEIGPDDGGIILLVSNAVKRAAIKVLFRSIEVDEDADPLNFIVTDGVHSASFTYFGNDGADNEGQFIGDQPDDAQYGLGVVFEAFNATGDLDGWVATVRDTGLSALRTRVEALEA